MNQSRALHRNSFAGGLTAAMTAVLCSAALGQMPQAAQSPVAQSPVAQSPVAQSPYVLHTQIPPQRLAKLRTELDELQADLQQTLGIAAPREKIHLYLFRDKGSYQRYLSKHLPKAPRRRALFVKDRGTSMVFAYESRDFDVDVRHETTHALLHASLPMVPLWLDEGLAEYFEVPRDERAGGNPHLSTARWNLRIGLRPKLDVLESKQKVEDFGRGDYRNAWAWVHFMLHGPPAAKQELTAFLADIVQNTPPGRISDRLRMRIPNVDDEIAGHLKKKW